MPSLRWSPLVLLTLVGCTPPPSDPEFTAVREIVLEEVAHHPLMEPRDLYKLLYQSAMGSEHAVEDTVAARLWMERELVTMGEGPEAGAHEPMIDTIAPGGRVVLVHLRPWVAAGRSTDSLLAAFIRTGEVLVRDSALLDRRLAIAETLAARGELPFGAASWREQVEGARRGGYPAVHHS
ncbi:MAG TPA: hypothetical protein VF454_01510, partial [Gemmatimonadales bacterium]